MNYLLNLFASDEFKIAMISGLLVSVIIWFIAKLYRKHFVKPKLILEYKVRNHINSPEYRLPSEDNAEYYSEDCIMIYKQGLKVELIIHNHSKVDAYRPNLEIIDKPNKFKLEELKPNQVILANTSITLKGEYSFQYQRLAKERNKNVIYPTEFDNINFLLTYENEDGGNFNARYKNGISVN